MISAALVVHSAKLARRKLLDRPHIAVFVILEACSEDWALQRC